MAGGIVPIAVAGAVLVCLAGRMHFGHGTPAPAQVQAGGPIHGWSGWVSQTQPQSFTEQALHRAVALPGARSLGGLREFHNVFGCPFQSPCFLFAAHQRIQNLNWTNPLSACHRPVRGIYR